MTFNKETMQEDDSVTLCPHCYCATKSILSEDKTHYNCGKCRGLK